MALMALGKMTIPSALLGRIGISLLALLRGRRRSNLSRATQSAQPNPALPIHPCMHESVGAMSVP